MKTRSNIKKFLAALFAAVVVAVFLAGGFAGAEAANKQKEAESAYKKARKTLNADDYAEAAREFADIYKQYQETKYAARALYWQAYSQYKLGGKSDLKNAERALEVHLDKYSDTGTREDAMELYYRVLGQLAKGGDKDAAQKLAEDTGRQLDMVDDVDVDVDVDEKMAALHALINMRSEKALPILEKILTDPNPKNAELREQSLFLVSQLDSDKATDILIEVARNDPSPEVRQNAVFWLSQTHSDKAADFLEELLVESDDPEIQEKVVFALSQIGDARALATLRRIAMDRTKSEELRANAIFWLGQSGGLDDILFVKELYGKLEDAELKEKVIFSVAQGSRNGDWLLEIVNDPKEPAEVRKQALFWAGQSNAIDAEGLAKVFRTSKDPEMREQAIFALSQRPEKKAIKIMIELAREEKNPRMRKQLVFWIGQSGDPDAEEFLLEIIND
jgi:HEAT repeat protein/predicted negative regulator of RcsB-dependent stress response